MIYNFQSKGVFKEMEFLVALLSPILNDTLVVGEKHSDNIPIASPVYSAIALKLQTTGFNK